MTFDNVSYASAFLVKGIKPILSPKGGGGEIREFEAERHKN